jgi:hypothetical protein
MEVVEGDEEEEEIEEDDYEIDNEVIEDNKH